MNEIDASRPKAYAGGTCRLGSTSIESAELSYVTINVTRFVTDNIEMLNKPDQVMNVMTVKQDLLKNAIYIKEYNLNYIKISY